MTLQNINNTYPNSQEKSLNGVLNINNTPEPNTEALELFFLYMEDDLAPLEVPFVPRKEHETSKLALNFRTSPKKFKRYKSASKYKNYCNTIKNAYPKLWQDLRDTYITFDSLNPTFVNSEESPIPQSIKLSLLNIGYTTEMGVIATQYFGRTLAKPVVYITSGIAAPVVLACGTTIRTVVVIYEFIRYQVINPLLGPILVPLFGDEWTQGRAALEQWLEKQRGVLGRHRGNTYISAFINRCQYFIGYFIAHQFYFFDKFIKSSFTIRRVIQSGLPISILGFIAYKNTQSPKKVPNQAISTIASSLNSHEFEQPRLSTRLQFDDEFGVLPKRELYRTGDGFLFGRVNYTLREFSGGEYVNAPKTQLENIIHPRELIRISQEEPSTIAKHNIQFFGDDEATQEYFGDTDIHINYGSIHKIGLYQWDPEEADAIPLIQDEEGQLTSKFEFGPQPVHGYKKLQKNDNKILKNYVRYKTRRTNREYREEIKKEGKKKLNKRKEILRPTIKKSYEKLDKKIRKLYEMYRPTDLVEKSENKTQIVNTYNKDKLALLDSPIYNSSWDKEYTESYNRNIGMDQIMVDPEINPLQYKPEQRPQRLTFSPFGVESRFCSAFDISATQPENVKPTIDKKTTNLFHYCFRNMSDLTEAVGVSPFHGASDMRFWYQKFLATETDISAKYPFLFQPNEEENENIEEDSDELSNELPAVEGQGLIEQSLTAELERVASNEIKPDQLINESDLIDEDVEVEEGEFDGNQFEEEENSFIEETEDLNTSHNQTFNDDDIEDFNGFEYFQDKAKKENPQQTQPLWFREGNLFLNQYESNPWNLNPWQTMGYIITSHIIFAGLVETCLKLESEGVRLQLVQAPTVHRTIEHIARMPEAVRMSQYVGETIRTVSVRKLLLAFQAKRGVQLYGQGFFGNMWVTTIKPLLASETIRSFRDLTAPIRHNFVDRNPVRPGELLIPTKGSNRPQKNLPHKLGLPDSLTPDIKGRYFHFDKVINKLENYIGPTISNGKPITPTLLTKRQKTVNRLGGEKMIMKGLEFGLRVQDEVNNFPLVPLITPGPYRMNRLPKGLILLGDSGNGRAYFVRALATEARLPLLITESNRYLHPKFGLVRLKTLFKRARDKAPSILFISDLDFMTRHRERYPSFGSVRATTHLLMAMDGFSSGETHTASERNIFVLGSMETTAMMDDACLRSGRFEWVLRFYYPPVKERQQMLKVHSKNSIVNITFGVDWEYYAKMTYGFSCLDIRSLINTSTMYALKTYSTAHTSDTVAYALGCVNHMHDLNGATFIEPVTLGFFEQSDFARRRDQATQYAPFFTQTGHVPMYKKLTNLFCLLTETEGETLKKRWNNSILEQDKIANYKANSPVGIEEGLICFLCEGLFLYNTQKAIGSYPVVAFNTYCSPVFEKTHAFVKTHISRYAMERCLTPQLFITEFDIWRHKHPTEWKPTGRLSETSISTRSQTTAMWRSTRFKKSYSIIGGLTELEHEFLFGVSPIANKIKNRMSFIGTKRIESYSCDSAVFGTFETNSDLSFKCRKDTTSRRVDQFSSELLGRFQKQRRSDKTKLQKVL